MSAITWSIKEIGHSKDVIAEIEKRSCPAPVKNAVKNLLYQYPEDAQVFVDTGGKLNDEYGTFNLRIEVNKNKKQ